MGMQGVDYTIEERNKILLYKVGYGEYKEWLENHKEYKVGKITDYESSTMIHYVVNVKKMTNIENK